MENVTIVSLLGADGVEIEHAIIAHADGSFTSMTKQAYDFSQVEHLTEIVPGNE